MAAQHEKTRFVRETLTQEARRFVEAAPYWRRVQLVLPSERRVFIQEDVPIDSTTKPPQLEPDGGKGWGANRVYKAPPLEGGQQIDFRLAPGQWLVGATESGTVHLTVIVEYLGARDA